MSRLKELIEELCPNGVEFKNIDEICIIQNGYTPLKNNSEYWEDGNIPWFRMEDIRKNGHELNDAIQHITDKGIRGKVFPANSLIFATTATVGEHALITVPFVCNQQLTHIHLKNEYKNKIDIRYLFHYAFIIDEMCKKNTKGGSTLPAVDLEKFKKFKIAVPPLKIQHEIVHILDDFTLLSAELSAELKARKQQYEFYREKLLKEKNETQLVYLEEILKIKNGKDYKYLREGNIPVYGSGGIMTYVNEFCYDKPSVLIPRKGSIDKLYYVENPFWNVDTIFYTEINENKAIPKYVYYYLQNEHLEKLNKAGGVPSLTQSILNKVKIALPSLEVQTKIVNVLDNFDSICSDLKIGLPAEIEARQKQYEFYRDTLLKYAATGEIIFREEKRREEKYN